MSEKFTNILQNPFSSRNLKLLEQVKFTKHQSELSHEDEHITRAYCLYFEKDYAELKNDISQINPKKFAVEFCIKNLQQNAEIKEIILSPMFKEREQVMLCSMFSHNKFKTASSFTKYICKETNFSNKLNEEKNKYDSTNFNVITKISKDNKFGKLLQQEIKIYDTLNKKERKM